MGRCKVTRSMLSNGLYFRDPFRFRKGRLVHELLSISQDSLLQDFHLHMAILII